MQPRSGNFRHDLKTQYEFNPKITGLGLNLTGSDRTQLTHQENGSKTG